MTMEDPYMRLLVHGTLPLVSDPGSPTGVRFAEIGIDAPEDCIRDASGLPQVEISLHVFANDHERNGYARALADFGDNAVSFLPSAPNAIAPPLGLIVRHDRERHLSGSLDDAIRLVSPPAGLADRFARLRASELQHRRDRDVYEDWKLRWKPELTMLGTIPGHMAVGPSNGADYVDFFAMGQCKETLRLVREEGGHSVIWLLKPELKWEEEADREAVIAEARNLDLVDREDGMIGTRPGPMDREAIEGAARKIARLREVLDESKFSRVKPVVWPRGAGITKP